MQHYKNFAREITAMCKDIGISDLEEEKEHTQIDRYISIYIYISG